MPLIHNKFSKNVKYSALKIKKLKNAKKKMFYFSKSLVYGTNFVLKKHCFREFRKNVICIEIGALFLKEYDSWNMNTF